MIEPCERLLISVNLHKQRKIICQLVVISHHIVINCYRNFPCTLDLFFLLHNIVLFENGKFGKCYDWQASPADSKRRRKGHRKQGEYCKGLFTQSGNASHIRFRLFANILYEPVKQ